MSRQSSKLDALVSWVNHFQVDEPIKNLSQLSDGTLFVKVINKINENEDGSKVLLLSVPERFEFVSHFVLKHCSDGAAAESMVDWVQIKQGTSSEIDLAKVVVLLLYSSTTSVTKPVETEELDFATQAQLASILRFIVENEDHLFLNNNLCTFLQKITVFDEPDIMMEELSPIVVRRRESRVQFIDLHKVASTSTLKSSPSSPMMDVLHTPQFKMHRLKKQLKEERALRDELELELTKNQKSITEKEAQILMMQQRIARLSYLCENQVDQKEPAELLELREKYESLLIRLHDSLKQCQDLKTDKGQSERKIDQLFEENGDLSYKVQDMKNRLKLAQNEVGEYEQAQHEWTVRENQMQNELGTAYSDKKALEEKILILQGKISLLEDQLEKMAESATQEKGEVMGDILKVQMHTLEALKQEVLELNIKVKELQEKIFQLEHEKGFMQVQLVAEKDHFDLEKRQLNDMIANLQTSLSEMVALKEKLEVEAHAQEERLVGQINTLNSEIYKMNTLLGQKDQSLDGFHQQVEEERKQKGQLEENLQKLEQVSIENIEGLRIQVDNLTSSLRHTESKLADSTQEMENEAIRMMAVTDAHEKVLIEQESLLLKFDEFKREKETQLDALSEQIKDLEGSRGALQTESKELKKEKLELSQKVEELDSTILDLIGKCQQLDAEHEAQSTKHVESVQSLKLQLTEQEHILTGYKTKSAHKELLTEENVLIRQQLLATEENIKKLQEQLQEERMSYADTLEERGKNLSELEDEVQDLSHQRDKAQEELVEEISRYELLEAQQKHQERDHQERSLKLQMELSEMSSVLANKDAQHEKLVIELSALRREYEEFRQGEALTISQMDSQISALNQDHEKLLQQLVAERARVADLEACAKNMNSEQQQCLLLQSELSKANTLLKQKESEEERLRNLVQTLQEKLDATQQTNSEVIAQLEGNLEKKADELDSISRMLSEERLRKTELEKTVKQHGVEAERMFSLESNLANSVLEIKEKAEAVERFSSDLQLLQSQISEIQQKHERELSLKDSKIKQLKVDKDQAIAGLATEKSSKLEAAAQLEQAIQKHKDELNTLQSELTSYSMLLSEKEEIQKQYKRELLEKNNEIKQLTEDKDHAMADLTAEKDSKLSIESQLEQSIIEQNDKIASLQSELASSNRLVSEKDELQQKYVHELSSKNHELKQLIEARDCVMADLTSERASKMAFAAQLEQATREHKDKLDSLQGDLAKSINEREEMQKKHEHELLGRDKDTKQLLEDTGSAKAELTTERASNLVVVAQLQQTVQEQKDQLASLQNELTKSASEKEQIEQLEKSIHRHKDEIASLQSELAHSSLCIAEKERQISKTTEESTTRDEALKAQQETVSMLQREVDTLKELKELLAKQENEIQNYKENVKASTTEMDGLKHLISEKESQLKLLEQKIDQQAEEISSIQVLHQEKITEMITLNGKVSQMEDKCKEQQDFIASLQIDAAQSKTTALERKSEVESQQVKLQALEAEVSHLKEKTSELENLLETSRVAQIEQENMIKNLKDKLFEKTKEVESSKTVIDTITVELSSMHSETQELENTSDSLKAQVSGCLQEVDMKNCAISTLEQELASYRLRISEVQSESVQLRLLIDEKSNKNKELVENVNKLQLTVASVAEKDTELKTLKKELADFKEHDEQIEELRKELSAQSKQQEDLHCKVSTWQQKCAEKEEDVSSLQQKLGSAQRCLDQMTAKNILLENQAEACLLERKRLEELENQIKTVDGLHLELKKASSELAELNGLKDRCSQQELMVRSLQAENASIQLQVCQLQQSNLQLLEKNKGLCEEISQGKKLFDEDLSILKEQHAQELEELKSELKLDSQKLAADLKEKSHETLEAMTIKYNDAKMKLLDERQKLLSQVELLEVSKNEHAKQLEDLNKKLSQHEKATKSLQQKLNGQESEFDLEAQHQKKLLLELQTQLVQKEQSAEHYKTQSEKAKLHYDAKKQQIQELSEELQTKEKVQEQLQHENANLKVELDRINKELQYTRMQAKDSEQSCKNLTSQVCSLKAQVEFSDRQLREYQRVQISTDSFKCRDVQSAAVNTRCLRNTADLSTDSLDFSDDDGIQLNSTRKNGPSYQETAAESRSLDSLTSQRLPPKVESLESLYFTPVTNRVQSKLESRIGSLDELVFDSDRKTRSARRRTTQVIITMTKKTEVQETDSTNTSFYSLRSAPSHHSLAQQKSRNVSRPQPAASVPSLNRFPSQESLEMLKPASSEDNVGHSALMGLPGYKPATRSSQRLSMAGGYNGATRRNSFYVGSGQDEPDSLDDFNRIAELQQRNRVCPPHLKTSYPLESRPTTGLVEITDEEMKTGDPNETLRRGSMLPSQIQAIASRRLTLAPSALEQNSNNITTRHKLKRMSEESHQGPETPESKKSATCFPRPMTPKESNRRKVAVQDTKKNDSQQQANRRQSMAFNILNTPRKIGDSLLRRGLGKKTPTSKNSPRGGGSSSSNTTKSQYSSIKNSPLRKSPRVVSTKSPRTQSKIFDRKQPKNKKT